MSTEQNKELVRQMVEEIFNQGNLDRVDELIVADFIDHEELPPGIPEGREGFRVLTAQFREAFPDFHVVVEGVEEAEGRRLPASMTADFAEPEPIG